MDPSTKRQLVGAAVLVALAVIFLPMIFSGSDEAEDVDVPVEVPPRPDDQPEPEELAEQPPEDLDEEPEDFTAEEPAGFEEPEASDDEPASPDEPERDEDEEQARDEPEETATEDETTDEAVDEVNGIAIASREQGAYSVQVGSFQEAENAERERDRIRDLGLPAYIESPDGEGSSFHRVRIGPVMERDEAQALLERAADEAGVEGYVVSR
ncbi:SPOR domain-containing protein [Halorhodospira halophila]|uniref:Sporulation domain protein n=1 Tax=Halorhodospira halophila (strain DSM 244 / SL1) TaxID=349124 RepID=A1WY02_HALHL|nr:SPOR domain-containing protein [Halorhodospira halophila]ABM62564.1 Sporulation domain protein [Halorhodospira halophila SL1]MBK1728243.1 hypothetical protein [Halorhodospira halophila]